MLSVPMILLIVAAVVGIVGIAFAITDAVKSRHAHNAAPAEKSRWGDDLGFRDNLEAVDAAIAQWSHGAAVDGGLNNPSDPAMGEFAGHPSIVFGQDDGLIVAVQRDTATDVVVEIHPQEPAVSDEGMAAGHATDLQVYSSDVDAMIRATDDRLVELLNKHPQDLAMAWSEGYWSVALLPLGDDGVDVTPATDQTINEQLPYVLNWLANLNDALKVLPPRAGEEEELALEGGGPSRPLADRSDTHSVPADADPIEPEESEFFVEESTAETTDVSDSADISDYSYDPVDSPDLDSEDEIDESEMFTAAGVGLAGVEAPGLKRTDSGIDHADNVIPFVPFGGEAVAADEDAVSQEELDAVVDDTALPETDNGDSAELVEDKAVESDLDAFPESSVDNQDNGLRLTEEASDYLHAVEEADALEAVEDLEWVEHSDDGTGVEPNHVDEASLTTEWIPEKLVEPADLSEDSDIDETDNYVTEADFLSNEELPFDSDDEDYTNTSNDDTDEAVDNHASSTVVVSNDITDAELDGVVSDDSDELSENDGRSADETETDGVEDHDVVDDARDKKSDDAVDNAPVSTISFVKPVASPEETGSLPIIKAQEPYYPAQDESTTEDTAVDDNDQHDFIVDIPESEPKPEPMVVGEPVQESEAFGGSHVAVDENEATMRTGEFPIIRPQEEGDGARHVLDEGERPAWFVPGKASRRSRSTHDDDE